LTSSVNNLSRTAGVASKSLQGIAGSMGGVLRGFQMLTPLATGAGLVGLAQRSIETGDALYDMSQRTGVSVESLSRLRKAAAVSGTNIDSVSTGLLRLSKAMVAAASGAGNMAERTQEETDRMVRVVKDGERQQVEAVEAAADKRVAAMERESDRRMTELNRRYRNEGKMLDDKYDDQTTQENQAREELLRQDERGMDKRYELRKRAIESDLTLSDQSKEEMIDALKIEQEDSLRVLRDGYSNQARERQRALRDARQKEQDALDDRKATEEQGLRASLEKQRSSIKASAAASVREIKSAADASVKALKGTDGAADVLSGQLDELGLSGKGASEAFRELGISIKNQDGSLRSSEAVMMDLADAFAKMEDGPNKAALAMKLFGRGGAELIPLLNMGSKEISAFSAMSTQFAKEADIASDSMVTLGQKVGGLGGKVATALLPLIIDATNSLTGLVQGFSELDPGMQKAIGYGAAFFIAWGPISGTLINTIKLIGMIAPAFAGLSAIGPIIAGLAGGITAAFTGLVTFLTTTILPALLAFFSGPAGWITLAVVAVIGMAIAFREPIGQFLTWLGEALPQGFNAAWEAVKKGTTEVWAWLGGKWQELAQAFNNVVVQPIISAWNAVTTAIPKAMNTAANAVASTWSKVMNGIRSVVNGVLSSIVGGINSVVGKINKLINAYNNLPGSPNIPNVPTMGVPAFALGGYVKGPTLALIGEGGEGESVVPDSKRLGFAMNVLGGMTGSAAVPKFANGGYVSGGTPPIMFYKNTSREMLNLPTPGASQSLAMNQQTGGTNYPKEVKINIQSTGPVMVMNNKEWVTKSQYMRDMQTLGDNLLGKLRTPAVRISSGAGRR
jgi:hypothetical protein